MGPAVDTAAEILAAAAALFAERGYAGATTRAIADRAGVNEVTLFRRFESKAGLLRALGERLAAGSAAAAVRRVADPADVRATLLELARIETEAARSDGGLALRLAFDARSVPEVARLLGDGPRRNLDGLAACLAGAQDAGAVRADLPPRLMAEAFLSLTSSLAMHRMVMGPADAPGAVAPEQDLGPLVELFWSGVARREGT
jgi:AcrR family transcriptional regulator